MNQSHHPTPPTPRTIIKVMTRSAFLHIQDALDIGKLRLWVGRYQKGSGTTAQATGYLDADAARVVLWDILARGGLPEKMYPGQKFEVFGGGTKEGQVIARVVKIREDSNLQRTPIVFEVATGPGRRLDTGAIQPIGELVTVGCYLSVFEARKLAAAVLDELQSARIVARLKGEKVAEGGD